MQANLSEILNRYAQTAADKDHEGHVALYDEKVLLFDMWDKWSLKGITALREMVSEWFASIGNDEQIRIEFEDEHSVVKSELGYITAIVKYSACSKEGKILRWLQNRMTLVLESKNGHWKIVHQHTSAPIGEDMKAKLQRQP